MKAHFSRIQVILTGAAVCLLWSLVEPPAAACDCLPDRRLPAEALPHYTAVFVGQVVKMWIPDSGDGAAVLPSEQQLVELRVLRAWKGVSGRTIVIRTTSDGECGYSFRLGQRYVVWGGAPDGTGRPFVHLCSRTTRWNTAPVDTDIKALDALLPSEDPKSR
jgi:hypothetical protein